jgi:photosystem II stability/assembly factor-like uncharacterized protein
MGRRKLGAKGDPDMKPFPMKLFLATKKGVFIAEQEDNLTWRFIQALTDYYITSIIAREGVILAGSTDGIFRSDDGGASWIEASNGLTVRHVRWLAFHPDISDCEFAGAEPASIFISNNGGSTWQEKSEVAALRDQFGWWLPYSPAAGCVRGFAFHGERAYAAVEVGGMLRSVDRGGSWKLAPGSNGRPEFVSPANNNIHADVHSVVIHPTSAELVFAPTGGGFYGSTDGGSNWTAFYSNCYVRAVWVDPTDPSRMLLGPANNASGENGRIEVTYDGGKTWEETAVSWQRNMVERFKPLGTHLFAILANGELLQTPIPTLQSNLATQNWMYILPEISQITDATIMMA